MNQLKGMRATGYLSVQYIMEDIKEVCGDQVRLWQRVYAYEVLAIVTF